MTVPAWPNGDPRTVARAIVADPRYRLGVAPPASGSWLDALWAWCIGRLHDVLHFIDRALGARNGYDGAIGIAVIVAASALVAFGIFVLVRSYARRTRGQRPRAATGTPSPGAAPTAQTLRVAANAAAQHGNYREAAALLFASAVRALDERERVAYDPARTPGEYRRLVRDPVFDALAGDAVVALFAAAEPRRELFDRMLGAYERFFSAPALR